MVWQEKPAGFVWLLWGTIPLKSVKNTDEKNRPSVLRHQRRVIWPRHCRSNRASLMLPLLKRDTKGGLDTPYLSFRASSTPVVPDAYEEYVNSHVKDVLVEQTHRLPTFTYARLLNAVNKRQRNLKGVPEFVVALCRDMRFLNVWMLKLQPQSCGNPK